jgi:RNA polymerase sigma-70 factor (ECF subfamily)
MEQKATMDQGELVKRFLENRDVILSFIYALTRDYDAAEEVFQNVAVAILQEAGRPAKVENFLAWAREVARHRVADYYRQGARRTAMEQPSGALVAAVSQAFAEHEIAAQTSHARMRSLLECLQRLTGRNRDVIEGFYRERKSLRDLAAGMGWTENSVKVALSRARKVLADCVHLKMRVQETG